MRFFILMMLMTLCSWPLSGWCEEQTLPAHGEIIQQLQESPEEPPYLLKVGVSGYLRGEGSNNFTYSLAGSGYTPDSGAGRLAYRIIPYLEWNPTAYLAITLQGQGYGFTLGSPRESQYSLYQTYLELSPLPAKWISLKLGRQEFVYGSAFILGGNSFYNGLTFDAARLRITPLAELTLDLLGGSYAAPQSRYFRDSLVGAYLTYPLREGSGIEAYYLRDQGPQLTHSGEQLESVGIRGTARFGPASLEIEPVYQSGRLADSTGRVEKIDAWGGHLDVTMDAEIKGVRNTFSCGYAYGSGSRDAADGRSTRREFSNTTNNSSLIGDMGLFHDLSGVTTNDGIHASGLQIATAGWGIDLLKNLNFTATGRSYRAAYTQAGMSRNLGVESDFILTWNMGDGTALILAYDHFFTGGFFREATGSTSDMEYGYAMLQFNLFTGMKKPASPAKGNP